MTDVGTLGRADGEGVLGLTVEAEDANVLAETVAVDEDTTPVVPGNATGDPDETVVVIVGKLMVLGTALATGVELAKLGVKVKLALLVEVPSDVSNEADGSGKAEVKVDVGREDNGSEVTGGRVESSGEADTEAGVASTVSTGEEDSKGVVTTSEDVV